jgi:hypothetical protein
MRELEDRMKREAEEREKKRDADEAARKELEETAKKEAAAEAAAKKKLLAAANVKQHRAKFCTECGTASEGGSFCLECGTELELVEPVKQEKAKPQRKMSRDVKRKQSRDNSKPLDDRFGMGGGGAHPHTISFKLNHDGQGAGKGTTDMGDFREVLGRLAQDFKFGGKAVTKWNKSSGSSSNSPIAADADANRTPDPVTEAAATVAANAPASVSPRKNDFRSTPVIGLAPPPNKTSPRNIFNQGRNMFHTTASGPLMADNSGPRTTESRPTNRKRNSFTSLGVGMGAGGSSAHDAFGDGSGWTQSSHTVHLDLRKVREAVANANAQTLSGPLQSRPLTGPISPRRNFASTPVVRQDVQANRKEQQPNAASGSSSGAEKGGQRDFRPSRMDHSSVPVAEKLQDGDEEEMRRAHSEGGAGSVEDDAPSFLSMSSSSIFSSLTRSSSNLLSEVRSASKVSVVESTRVKRGDKGGGWAKDATR